MVETTKKEYLEEIRKIVLGNRKYTIKIGDEALVLIDKLLKKSSTKKARKLYNKLNKLNIDIDLLEMIYFVRWGK